MTRTILSLGMLAFFFSAAFGEPPRRVNSSEAAQWRADLRVLARELPRLHKNAFHKISRSEFDRLIAELDRRIPKLSRPEVIVAFARLVAAIGDGHTGVRGLLYDSKIGFRYYPFATYMFADGLYVYAAAPEYRELIKCRITRIGNVSVAEAVRRVTDLIPRDNEMAIKESAPLYLTTPEILYAVGIIPDPELAEFTVARSGNEWTVTVRPVNATRPTNDNWALGQRFSKLPDWIDGRDGGLPLWQRQPEDYFRFEYLPDLSTVYVQYNDVANKEKETVADFAKRLFEFVDRNPVDKFILDLRWNTGGNNYLNKPLVVGILKSKIDQRGKLFTIIGRRTFSAAQNLVNDLQKYTQTLFVGEPTAGNPNFYGDAARIVLPNSGLAVGASTLWWQDLDPRLKRPWTGPDLFVELTSDDYFRSVDPAFKAIVDYKPQKPIDDEMMDNISKGNLPGALAMYSEFKARPVNRFVDTESRINSLGYRLIGQKRISEAIAIFRLNTATYPDSSNAWDSLAEAYTISGDVASAILAYRRVLVSDPQNANAAAKIKELQKRSPRPPR